MQAPQELMDSYPEIEDTGRKTLAAMVTAMDTGIGQAVSDVIFPRIVVINYATLPPV